MILVAAGGLLLLLLAVLVVGTPSRTRDAQDPEVEPSPAGEGERGVPAPRAPRSRAVTHVELHAPEPGAREQERSARRARPPSEWADIPRLPGGISTTPVPPPVPTAATEQPAGGPQAEKEPAYIARSPTPIIRERRRNMNKMQKIAMHHHDVSARAKALEKELTEAEQARAWGKDKIAEKRQELARLKQEATLAQEELESWIDVVKTYEAPYLKEMRSEAALP